VKLEPVAELKRLGVYGLGATVVLAMLSPVLRRPPVDSFPLSTYPMFSSPRKAVSRIDTVLGITKTGEAELLSPVLISGDAWPMLAVDLLQNARRGGSRPALSLCEAVAARVAADPYRADLYIELRFQTEVYDAPAYFLGTTTPRSVTAHARCPIR
jgi:hypothetical protein